VEHGLVREYGNSRAMLPDTQHTTWRIRPLYFLPFGLFPMRLDINRLPCHLMRRRHI